MYKRRPRFSTRQLPRHKIIHHSSMRSIFRTRITIFKLEIVEVDGGFVAGAEDGEGAGEMGWLSGGGVEEREQVVNEAHAGVEV